MKFLKQHIMNSQPTSENPSWILNQRLKKLIQDLRITYNVNKFRELNSKLNSEDSHQQKN